MPLLLKPCTFRITIKIFINISAKKSCTQKKNYLGPARIMRIYDENGGFLRLHSSLSLLAKWMGVDVAYCLPVFNITTTPFISDYSQPCQPTVQTQRQRTNKTQSSSSSCLFKRETFSVYPSDRNRSICFIRPHVAWHANYYSTAISSQTVIMDRKSIDLL